MEENQTQRTTKIMGTHDFKNDKRKKTKMVIKKFRTKLYRERKSNPREQKNKSIGKNNFKKVKEI